MNDSMRVWDKLCKSDPAHTKGFKRAGGFSGTAIKPIWAIKMLTETFGPVGIGWGQGKPDFTIVPADGGEVLVYCTVECWHTARENTFYGVGGDKAVAKNKNGLFTDDEAFKKAFTDATLNAFKSAGVAADIHMGLFDDDKYVAQVDREFAEAEKKPAKAKEMPTGPINDKTRDWLAAQIVAHGHNVASFCKARDVGNLKDVFYEDIAGHQEWLKANKKEVSA